MEKTSTPRPFWVLWLSVACSGVAAFGLLLVLAPKLAAQGFSVLVYAQPERIAGFGKEALEYIQLAHAVLGAVMFGWGAMLLLVVRGMFARGVPGSWFVVTVSLTAWFAPDTVFSLWSGFWQNAVLNVAFAVLFAVPLVATYRVFHDARA